MTMVIKIELKIFDQIVTSVSFDIKNGNSPKNAGALKMIACQTAPLTNCRLGGSYLFMKCHDFRQNADFFKESS